MNFKRKESFRFVFNEPIEATYEVYINGNRVNSETYPAKILDISPRGLKLFCGKEMEEFLRNDALQLAIHFVLDVTPIQTLGDIVWNKSLGKGVQCGVVLTTEEEIDKLIISEMKQRRKKEVLQAKQRKS